MSDGLYCPHWEELTGFLLRKSYEIISDNDDDRVSVEVRETENDVILIMLTWDNQTVTLTLPELRAVNRIVDDFKAGE